MPRTPQPPKEQPDEQAARLLQETEGRATRQRRDVLSRLLAAHEPISHADLQRLLPDHDRVSLYRVLDWLVDKGLVEPIATTDGIRRYIAHGVDDAPHPHFRCIKCQTTSCLHEVAISPPVVPDGYTVAHVATIISGTCPDCT